MLLRDADLSLVDELCLLNLVFGEDEVGTRFRREDASVKHHLRFALMRPNRCFRPKVFEDFVLVASHLL